MDLKQEPHISALRHGGGRRAVGEVILADSLCYVFVVVLMFGSFSKLSTLLIALKHEPSQFSAVF